MLDQGALIATSKFEGTDPRLIRMFNSYPGERYDDDSWHTVVLERTLQMVGSAPIQEIGYKLMFLPTQNVRSTSLQHSEKMAAVHVS